MNFAWDEAKRWSNIDKHGLDFLDARLIFAGPMIEAPARSVGGEPRWLATGRIEDVAVTLVFTRRGDTIRLISLRRARHAERAWLDTRFGSGA